MRFSRSKAGLAALCLAFVLSAAAAFTDEATSSASRTQEAAVVASVYDGDTLSAPGWSKGSPSAGRHAGASLGRVLFARGAGCAAQSCAAGKADRAREQIPRLDRVDRYGRLLRYVKRNGGNVNLELVRRGAAAPYFYRGERGRYAASLMRSALRAKACEARPVEGVSLDEARPYSCRRNRAQRSAGIRTRLRAASATRTTPAAASRHLRPIWTAQTFEQWASLPFESSAPTRIASTATTRARLRVGRPRPDRPGRRVPRPCRLAFSIPPCASCRRAFGTGRHRTRPGSRLSRGARGSASYAIDDGKRLLLFDPLGVPGEIEELAAGRETAIVLTCPWHERDTQSTGGAARRAGVRSRARNPRGSDGEVRYHRRAGRGGQPRLAFG